VANRKRVGVFFPAKLKGGRVLLAARCSTGAGIQFSNFTDLDFTINTIFISVIFTTLDD
jgi:hypothetical protein